MLKYSLILIVTLFLISCESAPIVPEETSSEKFDRIIKEQIQQSLEREFRNAIDNHINHGINREIKKSFKDSSRNPELNRLLNTIREKAKEETQILFSSNFIMALEQSLRE